MGTKTADEILGDLRTLLSDFQGREYSGEIGPSTLFFEDLGFASIDAVVLGETLETMYQRKIPFNKFLITLRQQQVQDIEVGRLAEFLRESLAS